MSNSMIGWSTPNIPPQKIISPLVLNLGAEVMNFPSLEIADSVQPLWFAVSANCTLTEEDVAGESGLSELYATRTLKVVTTANGTYAYQRYTYADQPRLKNGRSVAMLMAVWSVGGVPARVSLYSSVGQLYTSPSTTIAGWTILEIPQTLLDGTYVDVRFEVDTGTAYFTPITPWPRGLRRIDKHVATIINGVDPGAVWTDADFTSNTSNLAAVLDLKVHYQNNTTAGKAASVRRNGDSNANSAQEVIRATTTSVLFQGYTRVQCDDGQIVEYIGSDVSGNTEQLYIGLMGYEEWA